MPDGPNLELLGLLNKYIARPIIAEGRIWTREDALLAFSAGASAVVVGTAITNPLASTKRFVVAITASGNSQP